ncbi:g11007 [Coccomyxa viridis]|uniref:G11007 protein n=1 Tax=Coccomyxa viridis TaxID=1274662 RepID=A0ABP1G753_9CHLO
MQSRKNAPSGRVYSQEQLVALQFHMLSLATMADAGDCSAFAAYSPEVYRHGNYIASIKLDAADFSHPSGAAYVRVTGTLFTQPPPIRALSVYAASFFPESSSSASSCTFSEVASECGSLDSSSCHSDSAASSASSADTPLQPRRPRHQRRRNAKGSAGGSGRSSRGQGDRQYGSHACQ